MGRIRRAGQTGTAVDLMGLDGVSRLPEGVAVVAEGRASRLDRGSDDPMDVLSESIALLLGQGIARTQGVNARAEEGFVGVDVPESGDRGLIE